MELSIWLARMFGLYFVIIAVSMLLFPKHFKQLYLSLSSHEGIIIISGLLTLILGIVLVTVHNFWQMNWMLSITLIAWLLLIKGLVRLYGFRYAAQWTTWWLAHRSLYFSIAAVMLMVASFLLYHGYFLT